MRSTLLAGVAALAIAVGAAQAQDVAPLPETPEVDVPTPIEATAPPAARPAEFAATVAALVGGEGSLGTEALDQLVAPVALYPDALLAQVLVAATYPLDIVKAQRFLDETAALGAKERADAAAIQPWDASVQVLAGGFPEVVAMLAGDLDWTESLGDAVLAETDAVLAAIQRMRARADAAGNLESNAAQEVTETEGSISIAPADPEVVYVPTYDPAMAYYPTTPVETVTTTTGGDLLMTGAIAFGTALLVDEIFDDDDDWYGYWGGPPAFDWDDGDFYPRGGIDIEGDVNIDRDRIDVDRDRIDIDRGDREFGDRELGDRERRIGDGERLGGDRPGAWQPPADRQAAAREKIAARQAGGGAARGAAGDRLAARSDSGARQRLEAAGVGRELTAAPTRGASALRPQPGGPKTVRQASQRGASSLDANRARAARDFDRSPQRATGQAQRRPATVSRPSRPVASARPSPSRNASSFQRSGGSRPQAAAARGHRSAGTRSRSGGGRRR